MQGGGGEVKWGEKGNWKVGEMSLNVGDRERTTRETSLVATEMCSSDRLPALGSPLNLEHNLRRDYTSALIKLH